MSSTTTCPECAKTFDVQKDLSEGTPVECIACRKIFTHRIQAKPSTSIIGGYEVLEKIADGGMGQVFLARQLSMDRQVAFKILSQDITDDKDAVEAFLAEIRSLGKLDHPNIVTAFDSGYEKGTYYLVMSYIEGEDMDKRLGKQGPLNEKDVLEIALQVSKALTYAWDKAQLLHRDIKPANIMLDEFGTVKLLDFGVAKSLKKDGAQNDFLEGTPNYMSPEQASGRPLPDFRSDIYALGATLHHLLTGELPYKGITTEELVNKLNLAPLPPVQSYRSEISQGCSDLIRKMVAPDREQRFQSWPSLTKALEKRLKTGGSPAAAGARKKPAAQKKKIALNKGGAASLDTGRGPRPSKISVAPANRHVKSNKGMKVLYGLLTWAALLGVGTVAFYQFTDPAENSGENPGDGVNPDTPSPASSSLPPLIPDRTPDFRDPVVPPEAAPDPRLSAFRDRLQALRPHDLQGDPGILRNASAALENLRTQAADLGLTDELQLELDRVRRLQTGLERDGEFLELTQVSQKKLIEDTVRTARQDLTGKLLKQDFDGLKLSLYKAQKDLQELGAANRLDDIKTSLQKLTLMPDIMMQSFKKDVGKQQELALTSGPAMVRIKSVRGKNLFCEKLLLKDNAVVGAADMVLELDDLSPNEKAKRLADHDGPEFEIMRGILSYEMNMADTAKRFFEWANSPLGNLLIDQVK